MKKGLLFAMILGLFSLVSYAQNQTVDKSIKYSQTYTTLVGSVGDTLGTLDSTWSYTVQKLSTDKTFCNVYIGVDTVTGTSTDATYFILEYKAAIGESVYIPTDTVTYYQSADTTFNIQNSTAVIADFWRLRVIGTTDDVKSDIQRCDFKIVY